MVRWRRMMHRAARRLLATLVLLLLLLLVPPLSLGLPTTDADPYDAGVHGIVLRLLGEDNGQAFLDRVAFETLPVPTNGNDVFELESDGGSNSTSAGVVVTIRGSSSVALATGLGWYLRYYCKAYPASWDNRRVNGQATGRQLGTVDPARLPRVWPKLRRHSAVRWRYYMNVCTVSYSMAWWDWARWEEELDWMAISGINLALAFTGQEHIWAQLFEEYGVAREALTDGWFAGPAFAAWQRMGNLQKWGGPLSFTGFIEPQHRLQLQILGRMRELGIHPVLPAFAGFLPPALIPLLPANTSVTRLPDWNNFQAVYLLEPTDPLFPKLGQRFLELQHAAYGANATHMYSSDTFNEMDPRTNDPAYLQRASAGVVAGMRAADPQAVWVMQGWLFHSAFWTPDAIAAYLSGVPRGALLVLDLNANVEPVWPQLVANGVPFVWSLLHNYGGRRALYGNLPAIASLPGEDWARAGGWMVGTGITMEAIEHNPVVFDLMLEMAWRLRDRDGGDGPPLEVHAWAGEYAERRYGTADPRAKEAWRLLVDGVYSIGEEHSYALLSPIAREPRMRLECESMTDVAALAEAWGLLVAVAAGMGNATAVALSPLGYDVVDVTRQALADAFVEALGGFQLAFDEAMRARHAAAAVNTTSSSSRASTSRLQQRQSRLRDAALPRARLRRRMQSSSSSSSFTPPTRRTEEGAGPLRVFIDPCAPGRDDTTAPMDRLCCYGARLLHIIDDTEEILASNANFLFGAWIAAARAWGRTPEEQDLLEFNARNQVTLWGPTGQINDYASKQWAGLTKDYHRVRWSLFVAQALATAADPGASAFDEDAFHANVVAFGQDFGRQTQADVRYPTVPTGSTVAIARRLHQKYLLGWDV